MRTGITGATGLIGRSLAAELASRGHEVVAFTRGDGLPPGLPTSTQAVRWNPLHSEPDERLDEAIASLDAMVHLAGEPVGKRWTAERKRAIRESRVTGTRTLVQALGRSQSPPTRFLAASAIGYYGARGDEELAEDAAPGNDYLGTVCHEWESAAREAHPLGIETTCLRIGVVLSPDGGALANLLPPFRMGVGGRVGSGKQWMSWIHLADVTGAIAHLLDAQPGSLAPAYNLTAPEPVTNADFTRALGSVLRRPTIFPAPGFALRLAFGEMADALLLTGQRVIPNRLLDSGFAFSHPELKSALADLLGASR